MTTVSMDTNAAETFIARQSASGRRVSHINRTLALALPPTGPGPSSAASAHRNYGKAR